jgi:hypothetical protein
MWHGQEDTKYAYRVLGDETKGKRPLGGNQFRWKDNIKVGLKEIRW